MISLVRNISLKRKVKKSGENSVQSPKHVKRSPSKAKKTVSTQTKGNGGCPSKEWDRALATTIEPPLAKVVKTVSTEILQPISRMLREAWELDLEQIFSPLESAYFDPIEILNTISIKDITESVTITFMALVKKLAEDVVVPYLEATRVVLKNALGERFEMVVSWFENLVHAVVPVVLKALFGNQKESQTVQWVNTLMDQLLAALKGLPDEKDSKSGNQKPVIVSPEGPSSNQLFTKPNKHEMPLEELEGSLKETVLSFKEQVEKALS